LSLTINKSPMYPTYYLKVFPRTHYSFTFYTLSSVSGICNNDDRNWYLY